MEEKKVEHEAVLAAVREAAPEGRLPCATAFRVAEKLGVPPIVIGQAANELKFKITQCQLGCFK